VAVGIPVASADEAFDLDTDGFRLFRGRLRSSWPLSRTTISKPLSMGLSVFGSFVASSVPSGTSTSTFVASASYPFAMSSATTALTLS